MSARTHLPGRHRARVPGGRSADMVRAPRVRGEAGETSCALPPLRSFPSAAPGRGLGRAQEGGGAGLGQGGRALGRGGAWGRGPGQMRGRLASPICQIPGDAARVTRSAPRSLAWSQGGATRTPTASVFSSPGSTQACPRSQGLVGAWPDLLLCLREAFDLKR